MLFDHSERIIGLVKKPNILTTMWITSYSLRSFIKTECHVFTRFCMFNQSTKKVFETLINNDNNC